MKITDVELSALGIDVHAVIRYLEESGWTYSQEPAPCGGSYDSPNLGPDFGTHNVRPYYAVSVNCLHMILESVAHFEKREVADIIKDILDE